MENLIFENLYFNWTLVKFLLVILQEGKEWRNRTDKTQVEQTTPKWQRLGISNTATTGEGGDFVLHEPKKNICKHRFTSIGQRIFDLLSKNIRKNKKFKFH